MCRIVDEGASLMSPVLFIRDLRPWHFDATGSEWKREQLWAGASVGRMLTSQGCLEIRREYVRK
jgi:hypothetical protein